MKQMIDLGWVLSGVLFWVEVVHTTLTFLSLLSWLPRISNKKICATFSCDSSAEINSAKVETKSIAKIAKTITTANSSTTDSSWIHRLNSHWILLKQSLFFFLSLSLFIGFPKSPRPSRKVFQFIILDI